jgi:MFS family permease
MGGIINEAPFQETFSNPSASLLGTIVAIYEIGCCVGAIITAVVGERLGRRYSILIGAVIMLGATGFQAGVSSAGPMIAARVISGLGMVSHSTSTSTDRSGIHQLDCSRIPVRGLSSSFPRSIRLLPADSVEPRYLCRVLDRIRLHLGHR